MKLNSLEFALMNNPVRAASQSWLETPLLIGPRGSLAGKRVLEVGCGRGVGMEILLALGAAHITGFDLDPRMVALAQQRVAKYGDRARVFVGDAETINAPDASFDAVVDYGILHHIPNWPQALREIARVLRPGGVFYFEDLLRGLVSAWLVRDFFDHPQATQFYGREFRDGLEAAGLNVQKWRQWGEWGIMGQAGKQTALDKINA
jgi:ubiquinone/menaquinone biosynthesis C-methylase UbiE